MNYSKNNNCIKCDGILIFHHLSKQYGIVWECPKCNRRYIDKSDFPRLIVVDYKILYYNLAHKYKSLSEKGSQNKSKNKKNKNIDRIKNNSVNVKSCSLNEPVNKDLFAKYQKIMSGDFGGKEIKPGVIKSNNEINSSIYSGNRINELTGSEQVISIYDIVVKTAFKYMKDLSNVVPLTGIIRLSENETKKFNLFYNIDEDVYFGYKSDFDRLDLPYCRIIKYEDYTKKSNMELNPTSLLYSYGYNLTESSFDKRRRVLTFVIEHEIMSWKEIVNHLNFLVSIHKGQECTYHWKKDIQFVIDYVNPNPDSVNIKI